MNPFQKQLKPKANKLLRIEEDQIVQDDDAKTWTPRSMLALMDGVNSVRLAWILFQLGEEVRTSTPSLTAMVHPENSSPPQQAGEYEALLGSGMVHCYGHASQSFGAVTAEVDLLNESMSKQPPRKTKPNITKKWRSAGDDIGPQPQRTKTSYGCNSGTNAKGSKRRASPTMGSTTTFRDGSQGHGISSITKSMLEATTNTRAARNSTGPLNDVWRYPTESQRAFGQTQIEGKPPTTDSVVIL